jgi:hypothetical protein
LDIWLARVLSSTLLSNAQVLVADTFDALAFTLQLHLTHVVRSLLSFSANTPSLSSPRLSPAVFLARRISYTQARDLYFA